MIYEHDRGFEHTQYSKQKCYSFTTDVAPFTFGFATDVLPHALHHVQNKRTSDGRLSALSIPARVSPLSG